jgi:hypothetical protein
VIVRYAWPLRELNPRSDERPIVHGVAEKKPDRAHVDGPVVEPESPREPAVSDEPRPVETTPGTEPTDAELERAIVSAMLDGRGDVAEILARRLRARQHERTGTIDLVGRAWKRQRGG